jgi:hypothetical protein
MIDALANGNARAKSIRQARTAALIVFCLFKFFPPAIHLLLWTKLISFIEKSFRHEIGAFKNKPSNLGNNEASFLLFVMLLHD